VVAERSIICGIASSGAAPVQYSANQNVDTSDKRSGDLLMADSLMHRPMVYGSRARIGLIVPPTNTANEAEWHSMAPKDVSIHSARMPLHADTKSEAGISALHTDIEKFSADLNQAEVDVVAYGCTAGSMVSPVDSLAHFITEKTGCKALTTAQSIVKALQALNAKRIAVATPYFDAMNNHERLFLSENGFDVVSMEGLGFGSSGVTDFRNICRITPGEISDLARRVDSEDADAVLLTCTDLSTLSVINLLEKELGKPVVSSNTATFWYALQLCGIDGYVQSGGTLFKQTM
jgi:maleate cis-trans isomerase